MSGHFSIDVAQVTMFPGHEWLELGDLCPHGCKHEDMRVIAWGPAAGDYELLRCDVCRCRAWHDARWYEERDRVDGDSGFWWGRLEWRQVSEDSSDA